MKLTKFLLQDGIAFSKLIALCIDAGPLSNGIDLLSQEGCDVCITLHELFP